MSLMHIYAYLIFNMPESSFSSTQLLKTKNRHTQNALHVIVSMEPQEFICYSGQWHAFDMTGDILKCPSISSNHRENV